jgi:hypothetical protein
MRVHVTYKGKKTTISISDRLMDYFGALLVKENPKRHGNAKFQRNMAVEYIRSMVSDCPVHTPSLSGYVQDKIVWAIVDPDLHAILEKRGAPYDNSKKAQRARELVDLERMGLLPLIAKTAERLGTASAPHGAEKS